MKKEICKESFWNCDEFECEKNLRCNLDKDIKLYDSKFTELISIYSKSAVETVIYDKLLRFIKMIKI